MDDLEGMNKCPICLIDYDRGNHKPKFLSCHHTLCYFCCLNYEGQSKIPCPVCRKSTAITGSVDDLQTNFYITALLTKDPTATQSQPPVHAPTPDVPAENKLMATTDVTGKVHTMHTTDAPNIMARKEIEATILSAPVCGVCGHEYDQENWKHKRLIDCDHTMCFMCCIAHEHDNKFLQCPYCGQVTISSADSLPSVEDLREKFKEDRPKYLSEDDEMKLKSIVDQLKLQVPRTQFRKCMNELLKIHRNIRNEPMCSEHRRIAKCNKDFVEGISRHHWALEFLREAKWRSVGKCMVYGGNKSQTDTVIRVLLNERIICPGQAELGEYKGAEGGVISEKKQKYYKEQLMMEEFKERNMGEKAKWQGKPNKVNRNRFINDVESKRGEAQSSAYLHRQLDELSTRLTHSLCFNDGSNSSREPKPPPRRRRKK